MEHAQRLVVIARDDGGFDLEVLTYTPLDYRLVPDLSPAETWAWMKRPGTVVFFRHRTNELLEVPPESLRELAAAEGCQIRPTGHGDEDDG